MPTKLGQKLDYLVLNFVRTYINPQEKFVADFYDRCVKLALSNFLIMLINGILMYFFLFGLIFIFPGLRDHIHLAINWIEVPIAVILLGLISQTFRGIYRFLRVDYKTKGAS